jgi:hypothetical protein
MVRQAASAASAMSTCRPRNRVRAGRITTPTPGAAGVGDATRRSLKPLAPPPRVSRVMRREGLLASGSRPPSRKIQWR